MKFEILRNTQVASALNNPCHHKVGVIGLELTLYPVSNASDIKHVFP